MQARITLNYDPDGLYGAELVEKLKGLNFLEYKVYDIDGKEITSENELKKQGGTFFVHAEVKEEYKDHIELRYGENVKRVFDFQTGFPAGTELKPVQKITELYISKDYTGEEQTFELSFLAQHSAYLKIVESESDSLSQTNVGKYYIVIAFRDGAQYCWASADGSASGDRSAVTIELEIKSKTIEIETEIRSEGYTGLEIDILEMLQEKYGDYIELAYGSITKAKAAGEYEIKVVLSSAYGGNLKFADGTKIEADGSVIIRWTIPATELDGEWNEVGRIDFKEGIYAGGYEGVISYKYELITNGENTEVEFKDLKKGEKYRVTAVISESEKDNLYFKAGFNYVYEFTLNVDIAILSKPELVVKTKEYTGREITFEIKDWAKYAENVELIEGSLTQINAGTYTVKYRLTNKYAVWETDSTDDVTIEFEITKKVLTGEWNRTTGTINLHGNEELIIYRYYKYENGEKGEEVSASSLESGVTYLVEIELTEEAETNYRFSESLETSIVFTLDVDISVLDEPEIEISEIVYDGKSHTFVIKHFNGEYMKIIDGDLQQTNAGEYRIIIGIKAGSGATWKDGSVGNKEVTFVIKRHEINGEWGNDGRVHYTTSFEGGYDKVVEYVYLKKSTQEAVDYTELEEGETYIVTIKLRSEKNFRFADGLDQTYEFAYESGGGSNWWIWLLVALAAILVIIIIIIIIIVIKRRAQTEYEYEDVYEDGYNPDGVDSSEPETDTETPDYDGYGTDAGESGGLYGTDGTETYGTGDGGSVYSEYTSDQFDDDLGSDL